MQVCAMYQAGAGSLCQGEDARPVPARRAAIEPRETIVTGRFCVLCQGEGGSLGPLPVGSLLGHQGDYGGIAGDGQVRLERFLGGVQVVQRICVADGIAGTCILWAAAVFAVSGPERIIT
jgi:hypothetical protein